MKKSPRNPKGAGRPPLPPEERRKNFNVRLREETIEKIRVLALERDVSQAKFIEDIIEGL